MTVRIALIGNPRSRRNRMDPGGLPRLAASLGTDDRSYAPTSLDELADAVAGIAADPPDVLALHGGDGTMHRVFTALVPAFGGRPLPRVVVLRGGTMNIVASSVGMKLPAARALDLARSGGGRVVRRWLLRIDGDRYGFLFGNGIVARFLELYYEKPDPTPFDAGWLLARGVASTLVGGKLIRQLTRRWDGEVVVDGVAWPERSWIAVAVGSVEELGLGFTPFFLAGEQPGKMHVVGVGSGVVDLARELPRVWMGRPLVRPHNHGIAASEVELRGTEPSTFMIDGDFHTGTDTIRIGLGPPVDFVVP